MAIFTCLYTHTLTILKELKTLINFVYSHDYLLINLTKNSSSLELELDMISSSNK